MKSLNILFVGESHSVAVEAAVKTRPPSSHMFAVFDIRGYRPVVTETPAGPVFPEALQVDLRKRVASVATVISIIGGNKHNTFGLIAHPEPFDFFLSERPDLMTDESVRLVPESAIRESLEIRMRSELQAIRLLRELFGRTIYHAQTPPPLADEAHILAGADSFFREHGVASLGVSPRSLRLKVWLLQSRIVTEFCQRHDVIYIPLPPEVFDAEGLLNKKGYGPDATHGNRWFGERLLRNAARTVADSGQVLEKAS